MERLGARGDEAALDAGCGTGRVTALLLERLPRGSILAVDGSEAMVEAARGRFTGEPRVRVERQDLLSLEVGETLDLVFSTATFHWIGDHERLFGRLAKALVPGGRLVAQCGGEGNIAGATRATESVMATERFRPYFEGWRDDKYYADALATRARLEAAGFKEVETWLHDEVVEFGSEEELTRFLATVVLGGHVESLPEEEREPFAGAVAGEITATEGAPVLGYVRLNMDARRAG